MVKNFFLRHVFPRLFGEYERQFKAVGVNSLSALLERSKKIHQRRLEGSNPVSAFNWDGIIGEILPSAASTDDHPFEEALLHSLERYQVRPYPEVLPVLSRLSRIEGFNGVLLTNGFSSYQQPVLASCNLDQYFSKLYSPDRTGFVKPQLGSFEEIKKGEHRYLLHVGDKLETDIKGANSAGIKSWLVSRSSNLAEDLYLDSSKKKDLPKIEKMTEEDRPQLLSSSLKPAPEIVARLI